VPKGVEPALSRSVISATAKYLYQLLIFCMTAFEDLALLRAFLCIIECGSISAAARRGCQTSGTGGAGDQWSSRVLWGWKRL
jgi:hypothetical protein